MDQNILRFLVDYTKGTGRYALEGTCSTCGVVLPVSLDGNTCSACNGVADFYSRTNLDPREVKDAE